MYNESFRPLDGESFSKLFIIQDIYKNRFKSFRPLDGESFSKHTYNEHPKLVAKIQVSVP